MMPSKSLMELQQRTTLVNVDGEVLTFDIHDLYTARSCDELAEALKEQFPDGTVVHIRTSGSWPGGLLLHAGLRVGDHVFDIDGQHDAGEWFERWSRGMEVDFLLDPLESVYESDESRDFARAIAVELLDMADFSNLRQSAMTI